MPNQAANTINKSHKVVSAFGELVNLYGSLFMAAGMHKAATFYLKHTTLKPQQFQFPANFKLCTYVTELFLNIRATFKKCRCLPTVTLH